MTTYPKAEDLIDQSREFRIHHEFVEPPEGNIGFNPTVLIHRTLSVKQVGDHFTFVAFENACAITSEQDVKDHAAYLIAHPTDMTNPVPPPSCTEFIPLDTGQIPLAKAYTRTETPYDIPVFNRHQGFVLLELDHRINWRFMIESRGVTTKKFYGVDNFGVTYVKPPAIVGSRPSFTNPANDRFLAFSDCRILYFGLARRRPDNTPGQGWSEQGFNFHIEFFFPPHGQVPEKTMPTIFDPDVPNGGGASLP